MGYVHAEHIALVELHNPRHAVILLPIRLHGELAEEERLVRRLTQVRLGTALPSLDTKQQQDLFMPRGHAVVDGAERDLAVHVVVAGVEHRELAVRVAQALAHVANIVIVVGKPC